MCFSKLGSVTGTTVTSFDIVFGSRYFIKLTNLSHPMLEDVGPLETPGTIGFLFEFKRKWTHIMWVFCIILNKHVDKRPKFRHPRKGNKLRLKGMLAKSKRKATVSSNIHLMSSLKFRCLSGCESVTVLWLQNKLWLLERSASNSYFNKCFTVAGPTWIIIALLSKILT